MREPGIEPNVSSPPANSASIPLIRGDPSTRTVAIVLCWCASNRRRTRAANSGSADSIPLQEATAQHGTDHATVPATPSSRAPSGNLPFARGGALVGAAVAAIRISRADGGFVLHYTGGRDRALTADRERATAK